MCVQSSDTPTRELMEMSKSGRDTTKPLAEVTRRSKPLPRDGSQKDWTMSVGDVGNIHDDANENENNQSISKDKHQNNSNVTAV